MPTTTIRMSEELKARVTAAAKRADTTPHGFILAAIAEKTRHAEQRTELDVLADTRYANIIATGTAIPWPEMRTYLEARLAGKQVSPPAARKLGR